MGEAQRLDRPPAFIPDMTIVLLQGSRRLIYVIGKNMTRTVRLIRYPDGNCNLHKVNKMGFLSILSIKTQGRPVKSKKLNFTAKDNYALTSLFIRDT
jgi:hypothetical protein